MSEEEKRKSPQEFGIIIHRYIYIGDEIVRTKLVKVGDFFLLPTSMFSSNCSVNACKTGDVEFCGSCVGNVTRLSFPPPSK